MKRTACPHLGLRDDATTALGFPSAGNYCHHARPIAPPNNSYQEKYCLTSGHFECPVYQAAHPIPLPAVAAAPAPALDRRRVLAILAIPLLIATITALTLGWNRIQGQRNAAGAIPETGSSQTSQNLFGLDWFQEETSQTPFSPFRQLTPVAPTLSNCPMEEGWVTYIVNPTDSLYRLSVVYGVNIEEFQRVNCMGDQSVILPGQVIYVPYVPTNTPFVLSTTIPGQLQTATIRPPVIRPPGEETPEGQTKVPPTKIAPTRTPLVRTSTPFSALTPVPTSSQTVNPPVQTATTRPTNTPNPPTATLRPSSTSVILPTQTPFPTRTRRPTRTPRPQNTSTPVPLPTNTFILPTLPLPPTDTQAPPPPPTEPPPPPTDTPAPPPSDTTAPPPPPTEPPPPPVDTPEPSPTDTPNAEFSVLEILFDILGVEDE